MSNNNLHLFGICYLDLTTSTHINAILCASVPFAQIGGLSSEIGAIIFWLYYGHPQLAGKHLVRAMQRTQFRAKSAKCALKPTNFLKRNFYFETEGVLIGSNLKL
jgi:hypothetical protein